MDIPKITNGKGFKEMMELQKMLVEHYIRIEGLPGYPIDINTKPGQKLIRNFVGRFIMELCEAYTSLKDSLAALESNRPKDIKLAVINYNEEIADSFHFLLEILLYLGYDNKLLDMELERHLEHHGLEGLYITDDPLKTMFRVGQYLNSLINWDFITNQGYAAFSLNDLGDNPNWLGASRVNRDKVEKHAEFLWEITYQFNIALGELKNKDWSQTEVDMVSAKFFEKIIYILTIIFQYFNFAGITEQGLCISYQLKNEINKQRIKNGY